MAAVLPILDSSSAHTVRGLADPPGSRVFASLPVAMFRCRDCSPRHRPYGQPCGTLCPLVMGDTGHVTYPRYGYISSCVLSSLPLDPDLVNLDPSQPRFFVTEPSARRRWSRRQNSIQNWSLWLVPAL